MRVSCDFVFSNYRFFRIFFVQQSSEFNRYISYKLSFLFFLSPTLNEIQRWRKRELPKSRLLGRLSAPRRGEVGDEVAAAERNRENENEETDTHSMLAGYQSEF